MAMPANKCKKESETGLVGREYLADSLGPLSTEWLHAFKRIGQAQLTVLESTEGVIGQYLYLLHHIIV